MSSIVAEAKHVQKNPNQYLHIGFGIMVRAENVTMIAPFTGLVIKRIYYDLRHDGKVIDFTRGRKKRSVLFLDDGRLIGCAYKSDTVANNLV
jgi:regulator of extracellular matrix RemA (YlzA/DUF370 family)